MTNVLLLAHIIIGLLLIITILLQKTSSDSLTNLTSNNNSGFISAKGVADFLIKTTVVLAALFVINSIVLANLSNKKPSIIKTEETSQIPIAQ